MSTPARTSGAVSGVTSRDATMPGSPPPLAPGVDPATLPALVVGILEAVGCATILRAVGVNLLLLGLVHLLALGLLVWLLRASRRHKLDVSIPQLALIGTLALGPAGALGAAALGALSGTRIGTGRLIEEWYQRISMAVASDPVEELCENVGVGRTLNLAAAAPVSFPNAIAAGTLGERQAVLGLIARRFHTDYLPVLAAALKSEEPMIRVQAAAVAAHVRPQIDRLYRECADGAARAESDPKAALGLLARLKALIASGLLDEGERLRGTAIAERLADIAVGGQTVASRRFNAGTRAEAPVIEQLLIERRRFADLRMRRSRARVLEARPLARVRRLGGPAAGVQGALT